jgi:hypothetical protein
MHHESSVDDVQARDDGGQRVADVRLGRLALLKSILRISFRRNYEKCNIFPKSILQLNETFDRTCLQLIPRVDLKISFCCNLRTKIGQIYFQKLGKFIFKNWANLFSKIGQIYFQKLGKFTNKNCANLFSKIGHTRSL